MDKKRVTIDIAPDLYKKLQFDAVENDVPVKLLIERIVETKAKTLAYGLKFKNVGTHTNQIKK